MTACTNVKKKPRCETVWVRVVALAFLVGYLLFAHGCHGDEDTELLDKIPAVQGIMK
jgi:hypothetical protein